MKRLLTLCLVLAISLCRGATLAEQVTLEYKFTKGEVDKYRMVNDLAMSLPGGLGGSINAKVGMDLIQRTLDVLPDGSGRVQVTYKNMSFKVSGAKQQGAPPKIPEVSLVMTMTPQGRVTSLEGLGAMLAGGQMQGQDFSRLMSQFGYYGLFPNCLVEPGGMWKEVIPMPFGGGSMAISSTLVALNEQLWNQKAARVKQTYDARMDLGQMMQAAVTGTPLGDKERRIMSQISGSMELSGSGVMLFSPAMGKLLKSSGSVQATIRMNLPEEARRNGGPGSIEMPLSMTTEVTRFK